MHINGKRVSYFDVPENAMVTQVWPTVEAIAPFLKGLHPAAEGAVLGELLAIWVARCHPPETRAGAWETFTVMVRELIEINEKILHGERVAR